MMAANGSVCSSNSSFIYHHRHLDGPMISSFSFKNPSLVFDLHSKRMARISRPRTVITKLSSSSVGQEDPKAADDETRPLKVQEVYLTTTLDQEGIKNGLQRVLGKLILTDTV